MGKKDKGATALKERADARAKEAADIAREGVHQVAESAQKLSEVSTRKARRAEKKMEKSVRRHPAGWGAAALGLVAGVILGILVRRRRG
jgi:ElaB/YqjD/DUF883 family membrane-anchored ribosome-binding protein